MFNGGNNKRPLASFVVAAGNQALYNTAGSGNHINNTSTGAVRLASGQLGIFSGSTLGSVALNVATDATPTVLEAPVIYIAQGTADSADPANSTALYPLVARPFERTGDISRHAKILATKQGYRTPTNTIWVVGDTGALATGGISAADETEYGLTIAYKGRTIDEMYAGRDSVSFFAPAYTTPNYTALGTTNPEDHMIQNLMWLVNRNSYIMGSNGTGSEPVVGLALDLTGTVGTLVSSLTATYLPLVTLTSGATRGITLTANQVTNLQATLPTGSSIVTVNLATAGTAATGADAFAIMALDRKLSFKDRIPQIKVDIDLGLRYGFDWQQVYKAKLSYAFEGENTARQLDLEYRATHGQRKYNLNHVEDPIVEYPSPIDLTAIYTRYNIQYTDISHPDTFASIASPSLAVILIPNGSSTTISQFDSAINSWLESAGSDLLTIS
jgi:hypothetical protein